MSGYVARAYSTQHVCNKEAYGAQAVLLLLGPTLMMFTVTLVHTTFIAALNADEYCWVPLRFQRPIYLAINVVCIAIQVGGGIELAIAQSIHIAEIGSKLKIAAFVMQMVYWIYIVAENTTVCIRVGLAVKRADRAGLSAVPIAGSSISAVKESFQHYKRWSNLFGLAISIIVGRNLMRLTELGVKFLQDNEWPGYAFDGYQMAVVMGAWAVFYLPGKVAEVTRSQRRYEHVDRYGSQERVPLDTHKQVDGESTELDRIGTPRQMV